MDAVFCVGAPGTTTGTTCVAPTATGTTRTTVTTISVFVVSGKGNSLNPAAGAAGARTLSYGSIPGPAWAGRMVKRLAGTAQRVPAGRFLTCKRQES